MGGSLASFTGERLILETNRLEVTLLTLVSIEDIPVSVEHLLRSIELRLESIDSVSSIPDSALIDKFRDRVVYSYSCWWCTGFESDDLEIELDRDRDQRGLNGFAPVIVISSERLDPWDEILSRSTEDRPLGGCRRTQTRPRSNEERAEEVWEFSSLNLSSDSRSSSVLISGSQDLCPSIRSTSSPSSPSWII